IAANGTITADAGHAGCTTTGVTYTAPSSPNITPSNGSTLVHLAGAASMSTASLAACQGVTFKIPVSLGGQRRSLEPAIVEAPAGHAGCTTTGATYPAPSSPNITLSNGSTLVHLAGAASMSTASLSACQGATFNIPVSLAVQR